MDVYSTYVIPFLMYLMKLLTSNLGGTGVNAVSWDAQEWHQPPKVYDTADLRSLTTTPRDHYDFFNQTLDNILIVRVPGTAGHRKVNSYITKSMEDLGWTVEEDAFSANTPHGSRPFRNIIATLNPNACKRLVLACHYDSKVSRESVFLGATDSAVPCAQLIYLAKVLDGPLKHHRESFPRETTLQFIFFDGEEAFENWSATDSLYGSRHLAEKWNKTPFPKGDDKARCPGDYASELDRIDVLMLLDLLGTANPNFLSFFSNTNSLYGRLIKIERKLNEHRRLEAHHPETETSYFNNRRSFGYIEDDHIPFFKRGVMILHIIPSPFPSVWHKPTDNADALHHPTINNLNKIFKVFVAEYMHLDLSKL